MPAVRDRRLGGDAAQRALKFDGAVGRVGLHAGDEAADERNRVLHGLLDAVGRPGDRRDQRRRWCPLEFPVSCSRTSLMSMLAFMPLASRIWLPAVSIEMLPVVPGHVLHQERRQRAERHRDVVLHHALGGRATTSSARLRAYSSPPSRPAATSATTMTTTRTIDSGSRNRLLIFPSGDEPVCGALGRRALRRRCGSGGGGGPCGTVAAVGPAGPGRPGEPRDRSPPRFCPIELGEL